MTPFEAAPPIHWCDLCGRAFANAAGLGSHNAAHHGYRSSAPPRKARPRRPTRLSRRANHDDAIDVLLEILHGGRS